MQFNWITLTLGIGALLFITGIVFAILGHFFEATLFLAVAAGMLWVDFSESGEGKLTGREPLLYWKKIAGLAALGLAAISFVYLVVSTIWL